MYIKTLNLQNFRNYRSLDISFKPVSGITVLLGQNAVGKTNILEAVSMLAFPRSFRAHSPSDLITFGQNHYLIQGETVSSGETADLKLKIGYQKKPVKRLYQVNNSEVSLKQYLANFQTVMFTPEDIEILSGTPGLRRRLLDTIISQADREYFQYLVEFARVLKQRNALIKKYKDNRATKPEMLFWNSELVRLANAIHLIRIEFIDFTRTHIQEIYADISGDTDVQVSLNYKYSGLSGMNTHQTYEQSFQALIDSNFSHEVDAGHTLYGPHRDDFELKLNDKSVAEFCSRGEKRSFSLVLKLIELRFLQHITKSQPILLLDDVFSELDESRRKKLLDLSADYQTIITTVEKNYFADYQGDMQVFKVENEQVSLLT